MKTIYLAGGCFWGLQKFFDQFDGVVGTEVGYANGPDAAPTYQEVCHDSGHAETVLVEYDEEKIDLEKLLDYYFMVIDPLSYNRQGMDMGVQYDIIGKSGSFFSYNGNKIAQGREKLRMYLRENPEIKAEIEQKIRDAARGKKTEEEDAE